MKRGRALWVLARSVMLEAIRRKEIYLLVAACLLLIGLATSIDFFGLGGLVKFYRETALRLMGTFTALAVVLLAVRQLPREFEQRTIYPLLARPLPRGLFVLGKGLGVMGAALFCYALFMLIYVPGVWYLEGDLAWGLLGQHIYLQILQMGLLTSGAFLLSLLFSPDAALTLGLLLYFASGLIGQVAVTLYELTNAIGRLLLHAVTYALPQFVLFDLSGKVLHSEIWSPLSWPVVAALTGYAVVYGGLYGWGAYALFRRRPL